MTIPKVSAGESFRAHRKASTWNAFVDAANYHKMRTHPLSQTVPIGNEWPCTTVMVKNNTGAALNVGEVLGLNGPIITNADNLETFKSRVGFNGVSPTSAHHGKFVVLTESTPDGAIGLGALSGVVPVQVSISHTWITRADVNPSDTTKLLATPNGSAEILWIESGTGTKWALVRLGTHREASLVGKASGNIAAGSSSGTVEIWRNGVATGYSISNVRLDWMTGGEQVSNGKQVKVDWFWAESIWRITGAECED